MVTDDCAPTASSYVEPTPTTRASARARVRGGQLSSFGCAEEEREREIDKTKLGLGGAQFSRSGLNEQSLHRLERGACVPLF